jgi:hypothetical protein
VAVTVTHTTSATQPDSADGKISSNAWNEAHTITGLDKTAVGLGNVDNTSDLAKPISTATQAALDGKQAVGSYLTSNQTITLSGDASGSGSTAITVSIGANKVTRSMLAQTAGATILGATTAGNVTDLTAAQAKTFLAIASGDISGLGYFATGTDAANLTGTVAAGRMPALTGDVTTSAGTVATTVGKINGVALSGLATGILKNTTGTGVPSIAVAGDFPTLNQNTTGSAATLTTGRTISLTGDVTATTASFNGSANVSGAATIAAGAVSLAKMANLAANSIIGNNTGVSATPIALTTAQTKTLLAIAASDVSGLATVATSGSATDLSAGTLPAGRMPALTGDVTTSAGAVATTVKSLAPYASGYYYTPDGIYLTTAGATMVIGTIYLTPGYIRHAVTISALVTRITTLGTGNAQISIYASNATTGDPTGAPLFTSTSQSTGAAGIIQVATSQTIGPGMYWVGLQVDNTTVIFETVGPQSIGMQNISGLAASTNLITGSNAVGLTKTGTFGTWPTLTGNRSTDSLAEITSRPPAWAFRVA